jgi:hypothetical protein
MRWINIPVFLVLVSCHDKSRPAVPYSLRDTVMQSYLKGADSLLGFDTTDANYQLLKAYIEKDTNFLVRFRKNLELKYKFQHQLDTMDSFLHRPKLQELDVVEVYRFNYRMAFCPTTLDATISEKDGLVNLHLILY